MSSKVTLYQVPVPSTEFATEAVLCGDVIRFGYFENDSEFKGGIRFNRVRALRKRAESLCTVWHVEGAYDTLVEVKNSPWIQELQADITDKQNTGLQWAMNHYMIYLDSVGCFEFVAESWEALPGEPGAWT